MRPSLRAVLALLVPTLLGLVAATPTPARAQDDGGGHEAAGAEEAKGPEIEPSIAFIDRRSLIEIQLPKNWKADKFTEDNGRIAYWIWPIEDGAVAGVTIIQLTNYMRAPLARHGMLAARKTVEGTLRDGPGWAEVCGIEGDRLAVYDRYIEKDGVVWLAQFVCGKPNLEQFTPVFRAAMDSFKVTGHYEPEALPDGWTEKKLKDYQLWTDADADKVDDAAGLVEPLEDMLKLAQKSLPGKAVWEGPTRVKVIQNGTLFEKEAIENTGQKPDNAAYDARHRALLVKWMSRNSQGFEGDFLQFAANQLVSEHFGGNMPFWFSGGLRMYIFYGYQDGGKPQKPDKERISTVKTTIALAKLRLDQWFTTELADVPDTNRGFSEVWGWHWFFRHAKQGKKYRKTYDQCLETMRETGDPDKAIAVWQGTDFEKLFEDFKKWGESL